MRSIILGVEQTMIANRKATTLAFGVVLASAIALTTPANANNEPLKGAAIGAGIGAIAGGGTGAAIGAISGALVGGIVKHDRKEQKKNNNRYKN
ncbi:MAG: hypothetical protein ACR2OR_13670 [Hyphomicrobiales bacterium]